MISADFLSGVDGGYIADLYARFLHDRTAVDSSWAQIFAELGDDERSLLSELNGPSWAPRPAVVPAVNGKALHGVGTNGVANGALANGAVKVHGAAPTAALGLEELKVAVRDSIRALMLIRA